MPMRFNAAALLLVFLTCAKYKVKASSDWCYEGKECDAKHWGGTCKTGRSQSPINLNGTLARLAQGMPSNNGSLRFDSDYFAIYDKFYMLNNGHTIQVQLTENARSDCLVDGNELKGSYVFAQMHFHWGRSNHIGSEHIVDGKQYPMELHLVHFSDKYETLTAALQDNNRRAVAVLGIFFEITPRDNPAIQPIINQIPSFFDPTAHEIVPRLANGTLNLTALLPSSLDLWRYEGSLTTPSCAEKVVWSVFYKPIGISENQLNVFRRVKDIHNKPLVNNFRPTQPVAKRIVKFFNIDRPQVKLDDENSNEIEDSDSEATTNTFNQHDPDNHGNGIDHEVDQDHVHGGDDNSIDTNGDKHGHKGGSSGKQNSAQHNAGTSFVLSLCSKFLYFALLQCVKLLLWSY